MMNQSKHALILLGSLLLSTAPSKAQNQYDQSSYWFGFTAGAATTACMFFSEGFVSKEFAEAYVDGIRESIFTDPGLTEYKSDFLNAYEAVKMNPDCSGIFK